MSMVCGFKQVSSGKNPIWNAAKLNKYTFFEAPFEP